MSTRTLDLSTYPSKHQPLIDWITANGIEPRRVLISQRVHVTEDSITLNLMELDKNGLKILTRNGDRPLETKTTKPLISPPEAHGL